MLVKLIDITVPDLAYIRPERRSQLGSISMCVWSGRQSSRMWRSFTELRKVSLFWRLWRLCTSERSSPNLTPEMNTEVENWRFCFDSFSCSPFSFLLVYTNFKYFVYFSCIHWRCSWEWNDIIWKNGRFHIVYQPSLFVPFVLEMGFNGHKSMKTGRNRSNYVNTGRFFTDSFSVCSWMSSLFFDEVNLFPRRGHFWPKYLSLNAWNR